MTNLQIGMTKQEAKSIIKKMSVPREMKRLIKNFWQKDADQRITNEVELSMLKSWAMGSRKVAMPHGNGMSVFEGNGNFGEIEKHYETYVSDSQRGYYDKQPGQFDMFVKAQYKNTVTGEESNDVLWAEKDSSKSVEDLLIDVDNDGFADKRLRIVTELDENNIFVNRSEENYDL